MIPSAHALRLFSSLRRSPPKYTVSQAVRYYFRYQPSIRELFKPNNRTGQPGIIRDPTDYSSTSSQPSSSFAYLGLRPPSPEKNEKILKYSSLGSQEVPSTRTLTLPKKQKRRLICNNVGDLLFLLYSRTKCCLPPTFPLPKNKTPSKVVLYFVYFVPPPPPPSPPEYARDTQLTAAVRSTLVHRPATYIPLLHPSKRLCMPPPGGTH